jgi:DnaD/phage-associated family protein
MPASGFAAGTRYTPVPDPLLGPLLEEIQDLAELKCTMRVVYLLHRRRGASRCISEGELLADPVLVAGLGAPDRSAEDAIRRGLSLAVARGTFLAVRREGQGTIRRFLVLNDEAGRRAVERLGTEGALPDDAEVVEETPPVGPRPNIFGLYEENIGMLTPILADEMKEAEREYQRDWIEDAFKLAVARNVRNWRYIQATLRRWATEGRDDGESGRHTAKAAGQEGLAEYLRKRGRLPGS